jgi:hypothetical protein
MRFAVFFSLAVFPALPAIAEEPTTLGYVTTRGVVMKVSGFDIPVSYTPDGKFSAMEGVVKGSWRIQGDRLCSTSNMEPVEACISYPQGKRPGDEFEIAGPQGSLTIRING